MEIPYFRMTFKAFEQRVMKKWCLACYLIINWRIQDLVERVEADIPEHAYHVLAEHVYNYVYEDKMPPQAIASTVMNLADTFMRGEPVQLLAGDYIALQNFMRKQR